MSENEKQPEQGTGYGIEAFLDALGRLGQGMLSLNDATTLHSFGLINLAMKMLALDGTPMTALAAWLRVRLLALGKEGKEIFAGKSHLCDTSKCAECAELAEALKSEAFNALCNVVQEAVLDEDTATKWLLPQTAPMELAQKYLAAFLSIASIPLVEELILKAAEAKENGVPVTFSLTVAPKSSSGEHLKPQTPNEANMPYVPSIGLSERLPPAFPQKGEDAQQDSPKSSTLEPLTKPEDAQ